MSDKDKKCMLLDTGKVGKNTVEVLNRSSVEVAVV